MTTTDAMSIVLADYDEQIDHVSTNLAKFRAELSALDNIKKRYGRDLSPAEAKRYDDAEEAHRQCELRIEELIKQREREVKSAEQNQRYGLSRGYVVSEESVYTRTSAMAGGPSYFRDLWRATRYGDEGAFARLRRNDKHVRAYQARAGLTTVNGAGGELVPPLWLEEDWIPYVRPARKTANLCVNDMLPGGTDSINLPKINTGSAVAFQTTQNVTLNETDLTTTSISAGVYTAAGGQTLSIQLVEQSPINIDKVVMQDLAADYARFVDAAVVLNGSGSSQPTGILNLSGTNAITFTSASPTVALFYSKLAGAINAIETSRFAPPTHIVMHPRRWNWILSAQDAQSRPLVVPSGQNVNPVATFESNQAEGIVGEMVGLPVVLDPNLPTNLGAGTNQDTVIVMKADDLWLWEGRLQADMFPQTFASTASIYARLYNFVAFQPARYPQSISLINGTGLVAPTF